MLNSCLPAMFSSLSKLLDKRVTAQISEASYWRLCCVFWSMRTALLFVWNRFIMSCTWSREEIISCKQQINSSLVWAASNRFQQVWCHLLSMQYRCKRKSCLMFNTLCDEAFFLSILISKVMIQLFDNDVMVHGSESEIWGEYCFQIGQVSNLIKFCPHQRW